MFTLTTFLPVDPEEVFNAWMDSKKHTEMTGDTAVIEHATGGQFSAFSGYITGKTIELVYPEKIIQKWRTTEFPDNAPDSVLEISFSAEEEGCRLTLAHSGLPSEGSEQYKKGWQDYYFEPMRSYFSE